MEVGFLCFLGYTSNNSQGLETMDFKFCKGEKRVMGTMVIEKTTATLNDTCKIFKKIWTPWIIILINARQTWLPYDLSGWQHRWAGGVTPSGQIAPSLHFPLPPLPSTSRITLLHSPLPCIIKYSLLHSSSPPRHLVTEWIYTPRPTDTTGFTSGRADPIT